MTRMLDLWLFDKLFDPFAAWLHKIWGVSNYSVSKWFLTFATGSILASLYAIIMNQKEHTGILTLLAIMLDFSIAFAGFRTANTLETSFLTSPRKLPKNLRDGRYWEVVFRRFFLMLIWITVFLEGVLIARDPDHLWTKHGPRDWLLYAAWLLALIGYYFLSSTPRRPRPKEEKKKVESTSMVPDPSGA